LILLFVMAAVGLGYLYQIQLQKLYQQEQVLESTRRDLARLQADTEKKLADIVEKRKVVAGDVIAIAGEYRLLALSNCLDVTTGEATLRQAKELFSQEKYDEAFMVAAGGAESRPAQKSSLSGPAERYAVANSKKIVVDVRGKVGRCLAREQKEDSRSEPDLSPSSTGHPCL
jgi:hypothetical protein